MAGVVLHVLVRIAATNGIRMPGMMDNVCRHAAFITLPAYIT